MRLQKPSSSVNLAVCAVSKTRKRAFSIEELFHFGKSADLAFECLVILPFDLQFGL